MRLNRIIPVIFIAVGPTVFSLIMISASPAFAGIGVNEVTPYLYETKRAEDLCIVAERIDKAVPASALRLRFWNDVVRDEYRSVRKYKDLDYETKTRLNLPFRGGETRLETGLRSFSISVQSHFSDNELWIVYATSRAIAAAEDVRGNEIEMYVSVLTVAGAPMFTDMGISRSFTHLLRVKEWRDHHALGESVRAERGITLPSEDGFRLHPNLAMELHSFAAKVMLMRDPHKLWMITAPVPTMRDIFLKALPDNTYQGDSLRTAVELHGDRQRSGHESPQLRALKEEAELWTAGLRALAQRIATLQDELDDLTATIKSTSPAWMARRKAQLQSEIETLQRQRSARKEQERTRQKEFRRQIEAVKNSEIDELSRTMEITPKMAPIRRTWNPKHIQILDKSRKQVVFDHNKGTGIIMVAGETLSGPQTRRYDWFYHEDMGRNPYATVDAQALADLIGPTGQ